MVPAKFAALPLLLITLALTSCSTIPEGAKEEQAALVALEQKVGLPDGFKYRSGLPTPACALNLDCTYTDVLSISLAGPLTPGEVCAAVVDWAGEFEGAVVDPQPDGMYIQREPSAAAVAVDPAAPESAVAACVSAVTGSLDGNGNHFAVFIAHPDSLLPGADMTFQLTPLLLSEKDPLPTAESKIGWVLDGRLGIWN